eukprot:766748-Hanusia_phi.AAC.6
MVSYAYSVWADIAVADGVEYEDLHVELVVGRGVALHRGGSDRLQSAVGRRRSTSGNVPFETEVPAGILHFDLIQEPVVEENVAELDAAIVLQVKDRGPSQHVQLGQAGLIICDGMIRLVHHNPVDCELDGCQVDGQIDQVHAISDDSRTKVHYLIAEYGRELTALKFEAKPLGRDRVDIGVVQDPARGVLQHGVYHKENRVRVRDRAEIVGCHVRVIRKGDLRCRRGLAGEVVELGGKKLSFQVDEYWSGHNTVRESAVAGSIQIQGIALLLLIPSVRTQGTRRWTNRSWGHSGRRGDLNAQGITGLKMPGRPDSNGHIDVLDVLEPNSTAAADARVGRPVHCVAESSSEADLALHRLRPEVLSSDRYQGLACDWQQRALTRARSSH